MFSMLDETQMQDSLKFNLGLHPWLENLVKKGLRLEKVEKVYFQSCAKGNHPISPATFCRNVLNRLSVSFELPTEKLLELKKIQGPLVFVANHPFGAIEALVLMVLLEEVRGSFKILANSIFESLPELRPVAISVNLMDPIADRQKNISGMRQALSHLLRGGVLGMFPAGQVSSFHHWGAKKAFDIEWTSHLGRIVQRSQANVVPLFFEGRNSLFFQYLSLFMPEFRMALLAREVLNYKKPLRFWVGELIPYAELSHFSSPESLSVYLRGCSYALDSDVIRKHNACTPQFASLLNPLKTPFPQNSCFNSEPILKEIENLRKQGKCVLKKGNFEAFIFYREQAPEIVETLGYLRETTFREVGEGTGKTQDLDCFDLVYSHLILWDIKEKQLVGSYRIGLVDELLQFFGPDGLYTSTLFHWDPLFLKQHYNSLELGRSFIIKLYQKNFWSLHLLWMAIGIFLSQNRKYQFLFGPVSISGALQAETQSILVRFLKENYMQESAPLTGGGHLFAKPKNAFVSMLSGCKKSGAAPLPKSFLEMERWIQAGVSPDFKMPPLLKHYAALGGEILGFNVDPNFQNSVDCLFFLDLKKADSLILKRYVREPSKS